MSTRKNVLGLCAIVGATLGLGYASSLVTRSSVAPWYQGLKKPPLTPSPKVFAPVWTLLYSAMAISSWLVLKSPDRRKTRALAWFGGQFVVNLAWSPLFFGARKPGAALVNIVLLNALLTQTAWRFRSINKNTALLLAPYQAWVAFATYLNAGIFLLNLRKSFSK